MLVTVHPKDPAKIVGIESSFLSIGIVKTPELFCSLIGTISYQLFLFVVRRLSCDFGGTVYPTAKTRQILQILSEDTTQSTDTR